MNKKENKLEKNQGSCLLNRTAHQQQKPKQNPVDFIFKKFAYMEFWTNNSFHAAHYYCNLFGFTLYAYKNSYTHNHTQLIEYVLKNNDVIIVLKSPNVQNPEFTEFLQSHGDTMRSVAIEVDNIDKLQQHIYKKEIQIVKDKYIIEDQYGKVAMIEIQLFENVTFTFLQYLNFTGNFLPGYKQNLTKDEILSTGIGTINNIIDTPRYLKIDHIGFPQREGDLDNILQNFFKLGFHHFWSVDENIIFSENSTLRSTVMSDFNENVKFPIFEPKKKLKKSQIEEFLENNGGPGAQHIAIEVDDIVAVVENARKRGQQFLDIPNSYYDLVQQKMKEHKVNLHVDIEKMKKNKILIDFDNKGFLLQIFTKPVLDRPTLFFEFIQRHNNRGFGEGNFQRLFMAIEQEQKKRGNLVQIIQLYIQYNFLLKKFKIDNYNL